MLNETYHHSFMILFEKYVVLMLQFISIRLISFLKLLLIYDSASGLFVLTNCQTMACPFMCGESASCEREFIMLAYDGRVYP
mgnify:FL=1